MVENVDEAVQFYVTHLGFTVLIDASPAFAGVTKGKLRLLLSGKESSAGRVMPDGAIPVPGGRNRFQIIVDDLAAEVARLTADGLLFRNEIINGPGGSQILLVDPSGDFIELFEQAG